MLSERAGGGCVHPKGANSMAASGLSCRKPLVCSEWAFLSCFIQMRSSGHAEPPFVAVKLFSCSVGSTIGQEL